MGNIFWGRWYCLPVRNSYIFFVNKMKIILCSTGKPAFIHRHFLVSQCHFFIRIIITSKYMCAAHVTSCLHSTSNLSISPVQIATMEPVSQKRIIQLFPSTFIAGTVLMGQDKFPKPTFRFLYSTPSRRGTYPVLLNSRYSPIS